jgi:drug/metabolite transporter (DMT)-like permease
MSVPYGETVITANDAVKPGTDVLSTDGQVLRQSGRPALTAILGAACISSSAILVTLAHVGPVTTAFYRCALALPILVPLAVREQRKLGPRQWASRRIAFVAGFFLAIDLVLWNHAIADVGAGVATVLGNLQVVFVAAFAWLVLRERLERRYVVLLPAVLTGVVLVSGMLGGHQAGLHPLAGVWYGIATSAAYACFLLTLRNTGGQTPHVSGQLADATIGAAVGAIILGLPFGGLHLALSWRSFGWLLLLALLSQTLGWLLITSSLPRLPAAVSSLLLLLQPAAALVLAAIVLHERPTPLQITGALLVCLGVLALTWSPPSRGRGGSPEPASVTLGQAQPPGELAQAWTANST